MGLFFWKRKKELPVQRVERPGLKLRLKTKKKSYQATVAIVFKGKPLRQFTVTQDGYSRDRVAAEIDKELKIKLVSVVQKKAKR